MSFAQPRCLSSWFVRTLSGLALLFLSACGGGTAQGSQSTPTASNSSQNVAFDLGIPQQALQSPENGNLPDNTPLHVLLTFKPNDPLLNQLGSLQKNQSGQGTDASSLANQLGITDQQYQQIKQFFGIQGVMLNLNKLHTTLTIDVLAGSVAKLLHTTFVNRQYRGHTFFAPSTPVLLPKVIADHIQAITGLDNYSSQPHPATSQFQPLHIQTDQAGCVPGQGSHFVSDVRGTYGFDQFYAQNWKGQGMTILLPEFAAFSQSDLDQYLKCVNFQGSVQVINVNQKPPTQVDIEPLLDLEMVAGIAPFAKMVVYQTQNSPTAMQDVLSQISSDYANNHAPVQVSMSWGMAEDYQTINALNALDTQLRTLSQVEHMNLFVSSGDCGAYYSAEYPTNRDVDAPASDPYTIGVGGTDLTVDTNARRVKEAVWSGDPHNPADCQNTWGSGGGNSAFFPRPNWQQGTSGIQNQYSNGKRQVPDISAVATNLACFFQSQWGSCFGTSAATPIFASGYALINQGLVEKTHYFISGTPILYWISEHQSNQDPFYDVREGNNLYYSATPGWDYASGLGTPNLAGLYQALFNYIKSTP